jgi:hypothetical protein
MKLYKVSRFNTNLMQSLFNTIDVAEVINNNDATILHNGSLIVGIEDEKAEALKYSLGSPLKNVAITGTMSNNRFVYNGIEPEAIHGVGSWWNGTERIIEPVMMFNHAEQHYATYLKKQYQQACVLYADEQGDVTFV